MEPDTFRGDAGDVYWRRRMSVLVGALVVVAVVAWACSSGSDGPAGKSSAQSLESPPSEPVLSGLPTFSPSPTASPSPSASPSAKPSSTVKAVAAKPKQRKPGMPCERSDLVLSLQGREEIYAGSTQPGFVYTLVNTGPVMCTADVGPRALELLITSGDDRIWSTADCVSGQDGQIHKLERGIPFVRTVQWDRRRSAAACGKEGQAALPGTYVAVVDGGSLRSRKAVFHLR
ncbi:MAG: hypothetical protein HOV86_07065 [Thermoactinospora sp.]|nr:hypothetical protein [Thermoactinospora sp.]